MSKTDKIMALSYSLLWEQCSDIMSIKVEANWKYAETSREINMLGLLGCIKEVSYCCKGYFPNWESCGSYVNVRAF